MILKNEKNNGITILLLTAHMTFLSWLLIYSNSYIYMCVYLYNVNNSQSIEKLKKYDKISMQKALFRE